MRFDITIPVLNEEETLEKNVLTLNAFLKIHFPNTEQWRIVIADNGSTDNTLPIAENLTTQFSTIKVVKVPKKGVGLALKTAWAVSDADIVGYMDLDLATDLNHFLTVYDAIFNQNYDIVYGTRLHKNSKVVGRTIKREITSRIFNFMLKLYLGNRFSDGMCGFKFLKRKHFEALHQGGAISDGWFFSTELLTIAEWQKLKIYELPVHWTDDATNSKVNIPKLAKQYIDAMRVLKRKNHNQNSF